MNIYLHNKLQQVDEDAKVDTSIKIRFLVKPEHIVTKEADTAIPTLKTTIEITDDPSW